jgi:RNA polymerase sigma-70 factor (ECF subfamily)
MDTMSAAQAVEALIHEYYKLVFHTIYGLTGDWEESQDLTQDTFHQALKAIDAARAASGAQFRAKAWLLRIALNTVRMQRRRRNLFRFIPFSRMQRERREQTSEAETDAVDQQAAPVQPAGFGVSSASGRAANEDPAANIAERDAVQRTMARLPEALRTCLLLSVVGGFSTSEIAEILGISEVSVRQRLVRARKQFQQFYALESSEEISDSNNLQVVQTSSVDSDSPQNHVTFLHSHASPLL